MSIQCIWPQTAIELCHHKKLELCHTPHSNIHPFISQIEKNKVWEWIQNQSSKKITTFCIVCLACHMCGISIKWRIKTSRSPIYNKKYTCTGSGLTKVYPSLYLVRQDKGSWVAGIENLRHDYLYSHLPRSILQKKMASLLPLYASYLKTIKKLASTIIYELRAIR